MGDSFDDERFVQGCYANWNDPSGWIGKTMKKGSIALFLALVTGSAFGYDAVFYCTYQYAECVPGQSTVKVSPDEMEQLLRRVTALKENFIGFVDSTGTTLQFFVDSPDLIWMEIPVPDEKGSYGKQLSTDEARALIKALEEPYMDYRKRLNLQFVHW